MTTPENIYDSLRVGDLLEFKRGMYSHWAIYIGSDEVVHLSGVDDDGLGVGAEHLFTISGKTFNKAIVRVDDFWKVVSGSTVCVNNSKDKKWKPYEEAEIVQRALSKVGRVGYNIIFSNCEHFVSWCRYNMEKSDQVDSYATGFFVGVAVAATAAIVALISGGQKDEKKSIKDENRKENCNEN